MKHAVELRRLSLLGVVVASLALLLLVLPSLYPLEGLPRALLALGCFVVGFVINLTLVVREAGRDTRLAVAGLVVGGATVLLFLGRLFGPF